MCRLAQLIEVPPNPNFQRPVQMLLSFGILSSSIDLKALNGPMAFPGDLSMQYQFESYLRAMTGESRDH